MVFIAKIVVDVPSMQTNQIYDYRIPVTLQNVVTIGHRVVVPFGHRTVQGFVVDVMHTSEIVREDLKDVISVMDIEPVLNAELLTLGTFLSQQLFSFLVSCYHTMLPSLLKANYDKVVEWVSDESEPDVFVNKQLSWHDVLQQDLLSQVSQWRKKEQVVVRHLVQSKAKHKMQNIVTLCVPLDVIHVKKNAVQQQKLVSLLSEDTRIEQHVLSKQGISSSTIKAMVEKGWVTVESVKVERDPFEDRVFERTAPLVLTSEQKVVYDTVKESVDKAIYKPYVLEGVTGSGKTEVYLQLIADVIKKGKTALMLVPEIALTPQMVQRFKGRFGNKVAVLHSALSDGERFDEWTKIYEKRADIVVGARSSVFAPLTNIGMIIVDEEHESTYKQMDGVRYHARDVALWRGEYHHCPVILGSATPSLESRARAQKNVYQLLQMKTRANQQSLPRVDVVDMSKLDPNQVLSPQLIQAIEQRLERKEQVALLLNRRGYSSFVMCRDCGHVDSCQNCDISLTLHMDTKTMKCHYCGHESHIKQTCPKCLSHKMKYFGVGTQRVEEELHKVFPQARVIRMDVDTTRQKGKHEALLSKFERGEADILLGTQMIAKGLDFPNITLVGVVNADTSLNLPDFRATEKTYQLLTQVAGRAGRGALTGEVIVQTFNPEHYVVQLAQKQDYELFYQREMAMRRLGKYAPYYFSTAVTIKSSSEDDALQEAYVIKQMIERYRHEDVYVLGPTVKSIARINNQFYFQILLKYKNKAWVTKALSDIAEYAQILEKKKIYVAVDVEPMNFM